MRTASHSFTLAAFGLLLSSASQAAVIGYDLHWLDAPSDSYYAEATAINNQRQVAGLVDNHAALWNASLQPTVSSVPASRANDINNLGQIVGTSGDQWDSSAQGVLWSPAGVPRAIGMLPAAINDAGQIVGNVSTGNDTHAVMWDGTKLVSLDGGKYTYSSASDINNHGLVAGTIALGSGSSTESHAVVWQGTQIINLGSAGADSHAWAINDLNQVAGQSFTLGEGGTIDGYVNAMLWTTSGAINLGAALNRADTYSWGLAINNRGQVLGSAAAYDPWGRFHTRAILWDEGRAIDLNDFLDPSAVQDGWVFTRAVGSNDLGDILVNAENGNVHKIVVLTVADTGYVVHDFQAVGVPEPSTYATMLMGLGALGWAVRRRRQAA